jgi:rubrerythrin
MESAESAITQETLKKLKDFQRNEVTEYHIYTRLSQRVKGERNREVLRRIAKDELRHYNFYKGYTQEDVEPSQRKITAFYWISRIFGLTFGLKLMEKGEERAKHVYKEVALEIPDVQHVAEEEDRHEHELLDLIEEEGLEYVSSIVLGLNDALVELTGTLAGLTFALQNTRLIALTGLITGIAASFSMGASLNPNSMLTPPYPRATSFACLSFNTRLPLIPIFPLITGSPSIEEAILPRCFIPHGSRILKSRILKSRILKRKEES